MAEHREPPETQKERLDQLWHAMIGTNGHGMITMFNEFRKEMNEFMKESREFQTALAHRLVQLESSVWTRDAHDKWEAGHDAEQDRYRRDIVDKWERRKMSAREWLMLLLTLVLAIATAGAWLK